MLPVYLFIYYGTSHYFTYMKGLDKMKIEVNNLSKKFDENLVLKNVNLEFESGKTYGFIGRNGSGKSVFFKMLCGFYMPTAGEILVDGKNINDNNSFLPDTRVLIENPNFLPGISGIENLKILADIQNRITIEQINKALDIVDLSKIDRMKKYHKYSLGMKQKLGIAQVIMENPKIMIFDEPFNGIENSSILKIKTYLKSINNQEKIIIIASHVIEDIEELCDDIYKVSDFTITKKEK
jgi:ABC-2 type transport system ATP-binding protein